MSFIHFPKARYWVNVRALKAYIFWSWHTSQREGKRDFRQLLRQLWCPTLAFSLPDLLTRTLGVALQLDVAPGWARYPTDGTRLQVFDVKERRIGKVLLPDVCSSSLATELTARQRVGSLAPAVIAVSHQANAYVEEWIVARRPAYSVNVLERALRHLQNTLYDVEWIDLNQFLVRLARWGQVPDTLLEAIHCAFANLGTKAHIPWSMVHGDLVEQNLLLNQVDEMILIDWEYTRGCIATYDCWLYQYDHERALGSVDAPVFCQRFSACLKGLAGIDAGDLCPRSVHALHLVERIHYLAHVSPHTTHVIRQMMLSDMRNACKELAKSAQAL